LTVLLRQVKLHWTRTERVGNIHKVNQSKKGGEKEETRNL